MVRTEWGARGMGRGVARTCPKVAGAEVGAEGADAGERVEQRPRRGPAVVGEGHVDVDTVAPAPSGERGEEVLAEVAAPAHHQHPLALHLRQCPLLRRPSSLAERAS